MEAETFHVRVSQGRRVVLPTEACRRLKVGVGDMLIVKVEESGVELQSPDTVLARFRRLLNEKVPPGKSVVDDLIAERRRESERE